MFANDEEWQNWTEEQRQMKELSDAKEKIDQLQRQNFEKDASTARLIDFADGQGELKGDYNWEILKNETPTQCLQNIEAAAFENAKVSSQMKADCMGEVSFVIENGNCCPQCWHEPDDDCDICHGESGEGGHSNLLVQVPWDTMKDIWKMMNQSYSRQLRQESTNEQLEQGKG